MFSFIMNILLSYRIICFLKINIKITRALIVQICLLSPLVFEKE